MIGHPVEWMQVIKHCWSSPQNYNSITTFYHCKFFPYTLHIMSEETSPAHFSIQMPTHNAHFTTPDEHINHFSYKFTRITIDTEEESIRLNGSAMKDVISEIDSQEQSVTSEKVTKQLKRVTDPLTKKLERLCDPTKFLRHSSLRRNKEADNLGQGRCGPPALGLTVPFFP